MGDIGLPIRSADEPPAYDYPIHIEEAPLRGWDSKLFAQELLNRNIAPKAINLANDDVPTETQAGTGGRLKTGTWEGTQLAVTDMYNRIEQAYGTFYEASGFETSIPLNVENRNDLYQWSDGKDKYPPHLEAIPPNRVFAQTELFNRLGLAEAAIMLVNIVPDTFIGRVSEGLVECFRSLLFGENYKGATFAVLERNNSNLFRRRTATDIMQGANIGDLPDWWSDARWAQQYLTGTNPTTIRRAGTTWIERFHKAAEAQGRKGDIEFLAKATADSLYVLDYSYYREAVGAAPDVKLSAGKGDETKYCAAPVALLHLQDNGQLHPIAIVLDYVVDMAHSVVLFNRHLTAVEPGSALQPERLEAEKHDWPWRYAKQVTQMADWVLHEIVVHLTWTHLLEEATIVAANRAFQVDHAVFKLLEPHSYKTLSINEGARKALVPHIIFDLVGLEDEQCYNFINYHYKQFNWTERYVPADLEKRGFPLKDLNRRKYRDCGYARNMNEMWTCVRKFVEDMLHDFYPDDHVVEADQQIQTWCQECQTNGKITGFPTIKTREQLFDACTMAIHIASPQHTAINYLQNYYQAFIPNKPPALYTPVPTSLERLHDFVEADVLRSLPVNHQRDWLLGAHIPWLLSFKSAKESSLLEYSISLYNLVSKGAGVKDQTTAAIASRFYADLMRIGKVFERHSNEMTEGSVPYTVMDPAATAVSILL